MSDTEPNGTEQNNKCTQTNKIEFKSLDEIFAQIVIGKHVGAQFGNIWCVHYKLCENVTHGKITLVPKKRRIME